MGRLVLWVALLWVGWVCGLLRIGQFMSFLTVTGMLVCGFATGSLPESYATCSHEWIGLHMSDVIEYDAHSLC